MLGGGGGVAVRPLRDADRPWADGLIRERWGEAFVVVHGAVFQPASLPGFIAEGESGSCGLVTLSYGGTSCEVVTLDSLEEGRGVGRALLGAAKEEALRRGCTRLWLVTTNDNLRALRLYQR